MRKRVKPNPGQVLRHPRTKAVIGEAGAVVDVSDAYWRRRIKDGDCIVEEVGAPAPVNKDESQDGGES